MCRRLLFCVMISETKTIEQLIAALPNGSGSQVTELVQKAYDFAANAHGDAERVPGELYVHHDLTVAEIIRELNVDAISVAASLLHDVLLPHTDVTLAQLEKVFSHEVADLVQGVGRLYAYTKATTLPAEDGYIIDPAKLESIRQALLHIIEGDIRVILIRMADCLAALRMARELSAAERQEIAAEAMYIYAPLANRLGIWQLKWELEDLGFRYLQPAEYQAISIKLQERRTERMERVDAAVEKLQACLDNAGIEAKVTGRPKHIYSIFRKMKRKKLAFKDIYDKLAVRVVLKPVESADYWQMSVAGRDKYDGDACYTVLGEVHGLWQPVPREFDDYIANPKANGYQSLHTAVYLDKEKDEVLEVQIRSWRMHLEAEKGIAAHWQYKEQQAAPSISNNVQRKIQGLRDLLQTMQAGARLEETDFSGERIHVFTKDGDVFDLPPNSTPIDFAYQVHTLVGHRCRHARVNGKMVSLDYRLRSGDRVEIITAKRGGPSRDWMNASLGYTGSARTRSKIRGWFREQDREKNIEQGREQVERELKRLGLTDTFEPAEIAEALHYDDLEDFFAKVGFGDIVSSQISGAVAILKRKLKPDDELRPLLQPPPIKRPKSLVVKGLSGLHTKMAGCCNPIAPEPIVGYITRGHGVTIHKEGCPQLKALNEPERLIEVSWGEDAQTYPIPLVIDAFGGQNLIDSIVRILRVQQTSVPKTKTETDGASTRFYLIVEVTSMDELDRLTKKLEGLTNVISVSRQRWN